MVDNRVEKKRRKRKPRRTASLILTLLIVLVALYLLTLTVGIFGGEGLKASLRKYEFIDKPAEYVEQNLNLTSPTPTTVATEVTIVISVSEDTIMFEGSEVSLEELEQIISDRDASYVELIDDGAKRVTYSKVYDELVRLKVIIEEK